MNFSLCGLSRKLIAEKLLSFQSRADSLWSTTKHRSISIDVRSEVEFRGRSTVMNLGLIVEDVCLPSSASNVGNQKVILALHYGKCGKKQFEEAKLIQVLNWLRKHATVFRTQDIQDYVTRFLATLETVKVGKFLYHCLKYQSYSSFFVDRCYDAIV